MFKEIKNEKDVDNNETKDPTQVESFRWNTE